MDLDRLQEVIGYRFVNADLLREALTHRSFGQPHNERLEFLGDSVLNCAVSGELFCRYRDLKEGELSRLRAHHVRQESLYRVARKLDLGSFLRLGEGELKSGGFTRPSILADAFEALIGAVYLDGGYSVVSTKGAAHDQEFEVECLVDGLSVRTLGSGSSRRVAEQQAAQRAFEK